MSVKAILNFIQLPFFLIVSLLLIHSHGFGQIIHTMPEEPIITPRYDEPPFPDRRINLNGDGAFDLVFGRSGFFALPDPEYNITSVTTSFTPEPFTNLRFWNMDEEPNLAKVIGAGVWIGPEANWEEDPGYVMRRTESTFLDNHSIIWGGGFYDTIGFFGFELELENEDVLYGWIRLDGTDAEQSGLKVIDWAYNSSPGEGIEAGAIPEPATFAFLTGIFGLVLVLIFKCRVNRTRTVGESGSRGH